MPRAALSLRSLGSAACLGLVVAALAGCRPGTALHGRYNNFRAYYNAYYNAEQKLEEGEETLQGRNQKIDRGRLVELFPTGGASGGGGAFQETIDKSAELLRDRPTSKWADDALLLIGKAYFYQRNFAGAEQKFRETAQAAENRGEARLADEARFWLGRTYAASDRYDDGVAILQDALAEPGIDARWRAQIQLALGELYGRAQRWNDASTALREGIDGVGDSDLATRAYLLLGQVEEARGNWDAASEAYDLAARRAPAYELEYAARLSEALVLGVDAGRTEEAVDRIARMRRDDKNFQQRAEVELAWARIEAAGGDAASASQRFQDVLYDDELAGSAVRGQAHFRLGEFYRDTRGDFVRAAAHFDSAATALPATPDASVQLSRSAIRDADRTAETFRSVSATSSRMGEIDSLMTLAGLSEEAFAARIEEIEAARLEAFLLAQRQTNQLRANQAFQGEEGALATQSQTAAARAEAGFLGHRDPATVQAGLVAFQQVWGDRALVPDWRRRAAIEAAPVASGVGSGGEVSSRTRFPAGQGPPPLDLSAIPRTPQQLQQYTVEMAELRYELANALFLSLGRPDSAVALYRRILDETPEAPVSARARYALAEIEYAAGRADAAAPLFQDVIDADSASTLAAAARLRLGQAPSLDPEDRPELSDGSAAAFAAARARWTGGDPIGAMQDFIALAESDPDAPVAPRAFLAGAVAYADVARGDTLRLMSALPDSLAPALFRPPADADSSAGATPEPADAAIPREEVIPADEIAAPLDELAPQLNEETSDDAPVREADDGARQEERPVDAVEALPDLERPARPRPTGIPDDVPLREVDDRRPTPRPRQGGSGIDPDEIRPRDRRAIDPDEVRPGDQAEESVPAPPAGALPADAAALDSAQVALEEAPRPLDAPTDSTETALPSETDLPVETTVSPDAREEAAGELARPDSALADSASVVPPDALSAVEPGAAEPARTDSAQVAPVIVPGFTLADYLDALAARYPGTPEAERAQTLSASLPRAPAVAPPTERPLAAAPPPAPTPPPSPAFQDEPSGDDAPSEPSPAALPTPSVNLDTSPYGTFGARPIDPATGGYTRRTVALADAAAAGELARQLIAEGFRAAAATDGDELFVIVGQYPTDKALAIAAAELPAAVLGSGTAVIQIQSVELVLLVDGEDER